MALQLGKKEVSLNESERRHERAAQEARLASRKNLRDAGQGARAKLLGKETDPVTEPILQDDGLQADERNLASELAAEKTRKNAKDILLNEAVHIVVDEAGMQKTSLNAKLATRAKVVSISTLMQRKAPGAAQPSI